MVEVQVCQKRAAAQAFARLACKSASDILTPLDMPAIL
jgi:hypothetical protein